MLIPIYGYTGAAWVTLICYAFMSAATWYTGQKHYPVPYQMGKMAAYVALVMVLWTISIVPSPMLNNWSILLWALRVLLFAVFVGVVYLLEIKRTSTG